MRRGRESGSLRSRLRGPLRPVGAPGRLHLVLCAVRDCARAWLGGRRGIRGPDLHDQKVPRRGRRALLPRAALPWTSAALAEESPRQLGGWLPRRSLPLRPPGEAARREAERLHCGAGARPSWRRAGAMPPQPRPLAAGPGALGDTAEAPLPAGLARGRRQEPSCRSHELRRAAPQPRRLGSAGGEGPRPVPGEQRPPRGWAASAGCLGRAAGLKGPLGRGYRTSPGAADGGSWRGRGSRRVRSLLRKVACQEVLGNHLTEGAV